VYAPLILAGGLIAVVAMEHALITHDFSLAYVAQNNSRETPVLYSITGLWSALAGSILLWGLVLGGYATAMVWRFRSRADEDLIAWATLVVYVVAAFFFGLMLGPSDPFQHVVGAIPANGPGPNSLLQNNPLVLIHPPMLYLGLVGFTLPFAFAVASLITGRLDDDWQGETRRWTLFAWAFLTMGILLGAWWSYEVLGWGGFWGWDPVENAAVAGGYGLPPLGDGPAATRPPAHLEPLAGGGGVQPDHPGHLPDPFRGGPVGPLVLRLHHRAPVAVLLRVGGGRRGGPHRLAG
jgi:cytochrome c-type biogenesis protein CcmF